MGGASGAVIGVAVPPPKHEEHESQGRTRQTQNYTLPRWGGICQRQPGRLCSQDAPELVATPQLHLQQLLVRLADSADWIWRDLSPSAIPLFSPHQILMKRRLNMAVLTLLGFRGTRGCSQSKHRHPKSGFSSLLSAKQTATVPTFPVALGFVSLA